MRKVLRDINDLITEEPYREKIKIEDIDRIKRKRYKQEVYRKIIHNYLTENLRLYVVYMSTDHRANKKINLSLH